MEEWRSVRNSFFNVMVEKLERLRTRVADCATLALYGAKNGLF